jgi:hypothetical protein
MITYRVRNGSLIFHALSCTPVWKQWRVQAAVCGSQKYRTWSCGRRIIQFIHQVTAWVA